MVAINWLLSLSDTVKDLDKRLLKIIRKRHFYQILLSLPSLSHFKQKETSREMQTNLRKKTFMYSLFPASAM